MNAEQNEILSPASPSEAEQNGILVTNGCSAETVDNNADALDKSSHQMNGIYCDDSNNADNCLIRLVFKDHSTFDELHPLIGKCVRDALFLMQKSTNVIVDKDENCIKIIEMNDNNNDSIFMVDTLPTENANEAEIPNYDSSSIDILNDVNESDLNDGAIEDTGKPRGDCWNCGGDHNMRDCKEPRDQATINRNKMAFGQKSKTERYHLDAEQKYSHLAPGKISENLRQALGLRPRELPLYIYKMRLYGYPQGWLEEAKIKHSGLSLFHSENGAESNAEGGQADKVTFDSTKFIGYPGFNAEIPSNLIDEGDYYRVPPMMYQNSKDGLIEMLQGNLAKTYKRKRLKRDESQTEANVKDDDMEIEASDDDNSPVLFPQPRPDSVENNSNTVPEDVLEADSLLELKRKQEEILRALEDAASDSNSNELPSNDGPNDDPKEDDQKDDDPKDDVLMSDEVNENETLQTISSTDDKISIETESTISEIIETDSLQERVLNTPVASISGRSRESVFGTPLIKQVSPFSKLPGGEKWSVGVTDVIDFENLPDSTGTYRKLTGVIQKVRTTIKQINDDDYDSS